MSRVYFDLGGGPAPDGPDALRGVRVPVRPAPPADPFATWDHRGVHGGDVSQVSFDPAPLPAADRFVAVQASLAPCRVCGAARSHYVASAHAGAMVSVGDTANIHLCRRCWLELRGDGAPAVKADEAAG